MFDFITHVANQLRRRLELFIIKSEFSADDAEVGRLLATSHNRFELKSTFREQIDYKNITAFCFLSALLA